jgi:hypothetical protein
MRKLFLLTVVVLLSGCAGTPWYPGGNWDPWKPTDLELAFGKAYQAAISNQTINPDASENLSPVIGLDGKAARGSIEQYRKSFEQPHEAPQPIFQIGAETKK